MGRRPPARLRRPLLDQFYGAFAPLSITILGLWFIVVQTRHADWSRSQEYRRRASIVALQFALPGFMSLLALVNPPSHVMWRVSFTVTSVVGAGALAVLSTGLGGSSRIVRAGHVASLLLFVLVALTAASPDLLNTVGIHVAPLRVEATFLSMLVFLGLAVAWFLLFDVPQASSTDTAGEDGRAQ